MVITNNVIDQVVVFWKCMRRLPALSWPKSACSRPPFAFRSAGFGP